jgi:hypothetical protein
LSIAEIAERASRGEQVFDLAVREFLDSWQSLSPAERPEGPGRGAGSGRAG